MSKRFPFYTRRMPRLPTQKSTWQKLECYEKGDLNVIFGSKKPTLYGFGNRKNIAFYADLFKICMSIHFQTKSNDRIYAHISD